MSVQTVRFYRVRVSMPHASEPDRYGETPSLSGEYVMVAFDEGQGLPAERLRVHRSRIVRAQAVAR